MWRRIYDELTANNARQIYNLWWSNKSASGEKKKKILKFELLLGAVASAMRNFTCAGPLSALLAIDRSHRDQCKAHNQYIDGIFSDKESLMNMRNN